MPEKPAPHETASAAEPAAGTPPSGGQDQPAGLAALAGRLDHLDWLCHSLLTGQAELLEFLRDNADLIERARGMPDSPAAAVKALVRGAFDPRKRGGPADGG